MKCPKCNIVISVEKDYLGPVSCPCGFTGKVCKDICHSFFGDYNPSFVERSYYWVIRKFENVKYWFQKVRQRIKHGFALEESWNFYDHHAAWALPRLKYLRNDLVI